MSATRSSTESSSNGHTHVPKIACAMAGVPPPGAPPSRSTVAPEKSGSRSEASRAVVAAPSTAPTTRCQAGVSISACGPIGARVSMSAKSTSTTMAPT